MLCDDWFNGWKWTTDFEECEEYEDEIDEAEDEEGDDDLDTEDNQGSFEEQILLF